MTLVGTYRLGFRNIRLYVNPSSRNGSIDILPDDNGVSAIYVGLEGHRWEDMISILLHEAYELTLIDMGTRYGKQPSFTNEASAYVFLMTHNELSEAHDRVAEFLGVCFTDFRTAFDKYKNAKQKKKK